MCKRAGLLIGWDRAKNRALVAHAHCDSWSCPECAERLVSRWKLRAEIGARGIINRGERADFVTITMHENLGTFAQTYWVFQRAWPVLYSALKRQQNGLMYLIIPERHDDGRMHVHVLWNAEVSERWLKDNARKRGMGHQAKVKRMTEPIHAVWYATKYLTKTLGIDMPPRFHRVRTSQNWPDVPKPENDLAKLQWEYVATSAAIDSVYKECQAKHISLIDMQTGEVFEELGVQWIGASL